MVHLAFVLLFAYLLMTCFGKRARPSRSSCLQNCVGPTYAFAFCSFVSLTDLGCAGVVFLGWSCQILGSLLVRTLPMIIHTFLG